MGEREEDGDGVGEEEGGGAGRVDEGQGEHEDRAGDVERVKVGQTDHQTVESVYFLLPAAEDDDEEKVAEHSHDGHPQQHHSLDVEFKEVGKSLFLSRNVGLRHLHQERGRARVRYRGGVMGTGEPLLSLLLDPKYNIDHYDHTTHHTTPHQN